MSRRPLLPRVDPFDARRLAFLTLVCTLVAGCARPPQMSASAGQTRGYSQASLVSNCGPAGGVVVTLFLTDVRDDALPPRSGHYVHVTLQPVDITRGERTSWTESRGPMAGLCSGQNRCETALQGQLQFTDVEPGKWAKGELNLLFVNGVRVRKDFRAMWRRRNGPVFLCE
jgi:hypothetical protein